MRFLILLYVVPLWATTTITKIEATATEAVLTVATTQSGNCLFAASQGPVLTSTLVNDVNTTLFPASNSDARPGSVITANGIHKFVLGTRGQAGVQLSSFDNRAHSRALQQNSEYTVGVTCGSDPQTLATFYTVNPAGVAYREPRFWRQSPGDYAYPSQSWSTRGVCKIDPETGACVKLAALPGDFLANTGLQAQTFVPNLVGGTGWTGSGQSWNYSGISQGSLFLPITPLSTSNGSANFALTSTSGPTWAQITATLSGSAPAVLVCLSANYGQSCAGGQINQAITATPTAYTIGTQTAILDSWRNGPRPPVGQADVLTQTGVVTKSGTTVTWTSGNYFLASRWVSGSKITLGTSVCTIASMQSDIALTLQSSGCASDGTGIAYSATNFGFLIQPSTSANVTLAVSSPSWSIGSSGYVGMPTAGWLSDVCQVATSTGPTGPGNLCAPSAAYGPPENYNTVAPIFWIGQDGTVNLIGLAWGGGTIVSGLPDNSCNAQNMLFDGFQPGRFYCGRATSSGFVIFYVQYTGSYTATNPSFNQVMSNSTAMLVTSDVNALVETFETSGQFADFAAAYGGTVSWNIQSFENYGTKGALLLEARLPFTSGVQSDSMGWWAVYSLDSNTIIAAMCNYCGAAGSVNRWGGDHSGFGTRVGTTLFDTDNYIGYYSGTPMFLVGTTGQLTSTFSACPTNSFGATGNNCSPLTLNSLTPTNSGYTAGVAPGGQTLQAGDYLQTNDGGSGECVRIISLSGMVASVFRTQFTQFGGPCWITTTHAANLTMGVFPSGQKELVWNWSSDPHGTAVSVDPASADCHYGFTMATMILGCVNSNVPNQPPAGKPIRLGALPQNVNNPVFFANYDAAFGNQLVPYIVPQDNCMNSHPSATQENAPASEQLHFIDNRPYVGFGPICSSASTFLTPTLIGTYIYKVPASNLAALGYNYRVHSWLVSSGRQVAVDVSGPGSVLHDTIADNYKFCETLLANECVSGSSPGDVYINFPFVSYVGPYACASGSSSGPPRNDIDIAEMYLPLQGIEEVATNRGADPDGRGVRFLTSAFSRRCSQSLFWNSREVGLGGWVYTTVDYLDGVNAQPVIIQKPPAPQVTSRDLANFMPWPFSFGGGTSGDTVKIQYGYGEYDQGQLASGLVPPCNPRNEGCYTDSSGANPFVWASETQHPAMCASGCQIIANVLPAPGGRVVYFNRIRTNGASTRIGPLEIAVVGGNSVAFSNPGTPVTATPTFSPTGGSYAGTQTVTISDTTPSSSICFRTDGGVPTETGGSCNAPSTLYTTTVSVATSQTLTAIGFASGYLDSGVGTATYTIGGPGLISYGVGPNISGGSGTGTTPSFNTTGATLLVLIPSAFSYDTTALTITDAAANSWSHSANCTTSGSTVNTSFWYVENPITSASETVSLQTPGFSVYPGFIVAAFSGTALSGALDQSSCGAATSGTTIQPGSITPGVNGELLITGGSNCTSTSYSVNDSFSLIATVPYTTGSNCGATMWYQIQGTAGAINPTLTMSPANNPTAIIASFKP